MKAICNSSPIIGLSILGRLDILWKLFDIYIPKEVYDEIVNKGSNQSFGKMELFNAVKSGQIKVHKVKEKQLVEKSYGRLHKGELEVIVGAKEIDAKIVIIDDQSARNFAEDLNLKPIGLLGVLRLAKRKEIIHNIKPYIELLVSHKIRISQNIINQILEEVGEK
ncbi:DUF3368 domain-containing protein [Bacillus sp. 1P02SD]|uniref:DUF3368 domain-containing protein n=1 Tax=Bacillus sp. 1P02SD TaxID=3132264 RepID=UPI00399F1E52